MPRSAPLPCWKGQAAYIIGGGPSLKHFAWPQLVGRCTIGCNVAYQLGPLVCQVCCFGDQHFWNEHKEGLEAYGGWVATNRPGIPDPLPWLHRYNRQDEGLSTAPRTLAWNFNSGALAINLALLLGAQTVYLLGVDLTVAPGATHWHRQGTQPPTPEHHARFAEGFANVAAALPTTFPGSRVINVSDGCSRLMCFPVLPYKAVGLVPPGGV